MLTDALRPRLSRQVGLRGKAQRLQRRLQVLLGEHAVRHCGQQLDGLRRQLDGPAFSHTSTRPDPLPALTDPSVDLPSLGEFSQSSQAVLRGLQGALDSEATLSSSSDDESQEVRGRSGAADLSGSQERRRLEERAELGSRWSWLQVRLEDLEERTRQMGELHKHICSTKGKVVLADSQPLTDTQIQRTLLREMAGLSCTAMDTDNEPCSPTRLLYNIERQSAQLSQFVNSLLPPLSFSPVKQPQSCKHPKAFLSGQTNGPFLPRSSNRRRLLSSGTCKAEMSCVCARTRPLVSFHKPRLFALDTSSPTCPPDSGNSTSPLSSSSSSLSRSSSDPCSDPASTSGSRSSSLTSWTLNPTAPTASRFSFDNAMAKPGRETWSLRPLTGDIRPYGPTEHGQRSSTPVHRSQKLYNRHRRRSNSRVLDLSPIEAPGSSIQSRSRRANRKKRKRRRIHRPVDDKDVLYQLCDTEDSLDEFQEQRYTKVPPRQSPQGFVGKRRGESVYNINNIVIHMLAAKMEKLQYKVIMTPSWRVSDPSSLIHKEAEDEDGQEEDLADNVFAQRHLELEHREKSRWASWGTRKCHRRPKRCGDRSFGCRGGTLTSGEESSAEWRWAQLDTDEEQRSEEWLPQSPWERRMFPLNEDEEKALCGDNSTYKPSGRLSVCGSTPITPKNANSQLSPALLTGAASPSGGQNKNS
ncbi:KAT8 regulatory NSL complex subunit 1-like protein isoform X4 [Takifugu rubripes]|nr:KAT8 regulatory NSL complex subunit 1-like protein isoform X4 [Takifugu rubripes]XP_029695321.1 KAT8 regulatory NSL complex subunit 1-like protein isoform X4 [Takifugu rubripes]